MRGEPTLNKKLIPITKQFRKHCPQSQITLTSNGILLTKELAESFFENGGNVIALDCYGDTYCKYKERFLGMPTFDFYDGEVNPWHRHKNTFKAIVLIRDIKTETGKSRARTIYNQAGNVDFKRTRKYGLLPLSSPLSKKCVHPFREIVIFHNGDMPFCCRDWAEKCIVGNIHKINDLKKHWCNDERREMVRQLLYNKTRKFIVCDVCDYPGGMRVGLLPKYRLLGHLELLALEKEAEGKLGVHDGCGYANKSGVRAFLNE